MGMRQGWFTWQKTERMWTAPGCAQSSTASSQRPKSTRQAPPPEEFTKHHHKLGKSSIQNPNPEGSVLTPTLPTVVPPNLPFYSDSAQSFMGTRCIMFCASGGVAGHPVWSAVCGHSHARPPAASNCFILSHALHFPLASNALSMWLSPFQNLLTHQAGLYPFCWAHSHKPLFSLAHNPKDSFSLSPGLNVVSWFTPLFEWGLSSSIFLRKGV